MAHEGKKSEDEWFARHEKDLLRNIRIDRERKQKEIAELMKKEEARKLKDLHWMRCPKCGAGLYEQNLLGIRVDVCPICDGIHFDGEELQELVLKSQQERREILFRILGVHSSEDFSDAEGLFHSLKQERDFKNKELGWLLEQGEVRARKELHWMRCPKCGSELQEQDYDQLKVDVCTVCAGVYLDHLDFQSLLVKQTDVRKNVLKRVFGSLGKRP
jgi:Zn-finger nucleic acid-binding protein